MSNNKLSTIEVIAKLLEAHSKISNEEGHEFGLQAILDAACASQIATWPSLVKLAKEMNIKWE